jgi:hypothetical protein
MTVDELIATEEIRQLKARYFRFLDNKQWNDLQNVWTDDAILDMTEGRGSETPTDQVRFHVGREAIVAFIRSIIGDVQTVHQGHQFEVSFVSPEVARGQWAMTDILRWPTGAPVRELHGWGYYHDTYERISDTWLIKSSKLTRLRVDISPP